MSSSQMSKEIDLSNPLIEKRKSTEEDDDEKREMAMFDPERAPPESMDMFKVFLRIAVPSIFTNLSVEVTHLVSYTIAGHIAAEDSHELASLGDPSPGQFLRNWLQDVLGDDRVVVVRRLQPPASGMQFCNYSNYGVQVSVAVVCHSQL